MEKIRETRLRQIGKLILPAIVIFAAASFPRPGYGADAAEVTDWRISREADHFRSVATDRFMELLALGPGMTILDIGTGTGQFALWFAERLEGKGKVFATDIDNGCIHRLKEEAGRRGVDNLYPVLVNPKGVDAFYGRQKYDLVTMIHVPIPDRVDYLAEMRNYLAEDARVIVVVYKKAAAFSSEDLAGRFPDLLRDLSSEPADSPFRTGLRESTRRWLSRKEPAAEPDEALRRAVVEDFNRMASDTRFGLGFIDGSAIRKEVAFTSAERSFAEYLLVFLIEEKVFDKRAEKFSGRSPGPTDSSKASRVARRLNNLLFFQRFRKHLDKDRLFTPGMTRKMKGDFEKAGYRLEKEHLDIMPFEDVLVFR
ncbi:MAG: class I SAM-dependent methyltransferase [bacterium]|jgi:SAM-dependent methyltransferase